MTPAVIQAAVAVKPVGMTATAYIMLVFVIIGLPLLAGIWRQLLRNQPEMRKLEHEEDNSLRTLLLGRIESLEKKVDQNEAECAERIDSALKANDLRWENRLAEHKIASDAKISELQGDIRQILQQGSSAGHILKLGARAASNMGQTGIGE